MIHKTKPVGNAHPGMSPKTPGLDVKSQSAAVYEVCGNDPRLEFEVRLGGNVEFGRLPYLDISSYPKVFTQQLTVTSSKKFCVYAVYVMIIRRKSIKLSSYQ